ncbi:MAG: DUF3014 domain-containing protein [Burkholderiaceae bacterium]
MTPLRPPSSSGTPWWLIAIVVVIIIALFGAWRAGLLGGDGEIIPSRLGGAPDTSAPGTGPGGSLDADALTPVPPAPGVPPAEELLAQEAEEEALAQEEARKGPRYPVPALDEQARRNAPLPEPGIASDPPLAGALTTFGDRATLTEFFNLQDIARRFVITVDNLPREIVPTQASAVRRVPGPLAVEPTEDGFELQEANGLRYQAFLRFAESVDTATLARLYVRFYPLLQYEYQEMGFPEGHFNDRVIAAIDDMLAAPTPRGPIRLIQPKVLYRFADPALESLSAGQKIMVRIGPANAGRLRAVLLRLREELTTLGD